MPHHAILFFLNHLVFKLAGQHAFIVTPWLVLLVLGGIYGPIAYFMFRSGQSSEQ